MEELNKKEKYYDFYNKNLVDKAFNYVEQSNDLGVYFDANVKLAKAFTDDEEEFINTLRKLMHSNFIFSYIRGAIDNVGATKEECYADPSEKYSDYRKNKDFCVSYFFGDNDFGLHVENGAKLFTDGYNSKLSNIDLYVDDDDWDESTSLYVRDIKLMEKLETIQKILSYGITSHSIESYADYSLIFPEKGMSSTQDVSDDAVKNAEYLEVFDDKRYKVGTYAEVEKYIVEKYGNNKNETLKNIWCNGELLIIALVDGKMKYWIK